MRFLAPAAVFIAVIAVLYGTTEVYPTEEAVSYTKALEKKSV